MQVTFDRQRGVTSFSWAEDGSAVFYIQDTNGDENDHLYMVLLSALMPNGQPVKPIDLTPFKGVKASTIIGSKRFPGTRSVTVTIVTPDVIFR
jgi:hypothetical protein